MTTTSNTIKWNRISGGGGPLYSGYCQSTGITFYIARSKEPGFGYALKAYEKDGQGLGTLGNFETVSGAKSSAKRFGTLRN